MKRQKSRKKYYQSIHSRSNSNSPNSQIPQGSIFPKFIYYDSTKLSEKSTEKHYFKSEEEFNRKVRDERRKALLKLENLKNGKDRLKDRLGKIYGDRSKTQFSSVEEESENSEDSDEEKCEEKAIVPIDEENSKDK